MALGSGLVFLILSRLGDDFFELCQVVFQLDDSSIHAETPTREDGLDVGDSHEAEGSTKHGAHQVIGLAWFSREVHVPRCDDDPCALVFQQPRPTFGDLKCESWAHDVVDPGLQHGRNAVVVHRGADQEVVGRLQLFDQLEGKGEGGVHLRGPRHLGRCIDAQDPIHIHVGDLGLHQVTPNDLAVRMRFLPMLDEPIAEGSRDGFVATGAHFNAEKIGNDLLLVVRLFSN